MRSFVPLWIFPTEKSHTTTKSAIVTTSRYGAHSCWEEPNDIDHLHRHLTTKGKPPATRTRSANDSIGKGAIGSLVVVHISVRNANPKIAGQKIFRKR